MSDECIHMIAFFLFLRHHAVVSSAEVQPGMAKRTKMHVCHTEECITSIGSCYVLCST